MIAAAPGAGADQRDSCQSVDLDEVARTIEQQRWGKTFFELPGGSASAKLMPIEKPQHGEFSEDEGVLEEPGNETILYWAKRME